MFAMMVFPIGGPTPPEETSRNYQRLADQHGFTVELHVPQLPFMAREVGVGLCVSIRQPLLEGIRALGIFFEEAEQQGLTEPRLLLRHPSPRSAQIADVLESSITGWEVPLPGAGTSNILVARGLANIQLSPADSCLRATLSFHRGGHGDESRIDAWRGYRELAPTVGFQVVIAHPVERVHRSLLAVWLSIKQPLHQSTKVMANLIEEANGRGLDEPQIVIRYPCPDPDEMARPAWEEVAR